MFVKGPMNKIIITMLMAFISLSVNGIDHLKPLGDKGIYIYEGSEEFVDSFRSDSTTIEAIQIIYPSSAPMSLLLISQSDENEEFFVTTATNSKPKPESHTIPINKDLALKLLEVFDIVLKETKVPENDGILGTDGTDYLFYAFPYAGYQWNKGFDDKPSNLIEICEMMSNQIIRFGKLKNNGELMELISAIKK
jgi:hypothetical protein